MGDRSHECWGTLVQKAKPQCTLELRWNGSSGTATNMRNIPAYSQNSRIRELMRETKFDKFHDHILSHKSNLSNTRKKKTTQRRKITKDTRRILRPQISPKFTWEHSGESGKRCCLNLPFTVYQINHPGEKPYEWNTHVKTFSWSHILLMWDATYGRNTHVIECGKKFCWKSTFILHQSHYNCKEYGNAVFQNNCSLYIKELVKERSLCEVKPLTQKQRLSIKERNLGE